MKRSEKPETDIIAPFSNSVLCDDEMLLGWAEASEMLGSQSVAKKTPQDRNRLWVPDICGSNLDLQHLHSIVFTW